MEIFSFHLKSVVVAVVGLNSYEHWVSLDRSCIVLMSEVQIKGWAM